jgi:AcrR family transcriptional regulator
MKEIKSRKKQAICTKKRIVEAASDFFTKMPYEDIKITDICKSINVSVGTFYHYFNSKEEIINESYALFDEVLKTKWEEYHQITSYDSICYLITVQLDSICSENYLYATNLFKNQLTTKDKYILNEERYFYKTLLGIVSDAVNNNVLYGNPKEITDFIIRLSRGVIYDWCLREGSYNLVNQGIKDVIFILEKMRLTH